MVDYAGFVAWEGECGEASVGKVSDVRRTGTDGFAIFAMCFCLSFRYEFLYKS